MLISITTCSCRSFFSNAGGVESFVARAELAKTSRYSAGGALARAVPHILVPGVLAIALAGCAARPVSLPVAIVGDVIYDRDVESRSKDLVGRPPADADAMFGPRIDRLRTLDGVKTLAVYPVRDDPSRESRWVVLIEGQQITAVAKAQQQAEDAEDVIREAQFEEKLLGKSPAQFKREPGFEKPLVTASREATWTLVRLYDMGRMTNLRARYCVLEFDKQDRCTQVRLVGLNSLSQNTSAAAPSPAGKP